MGLYLHRKENIEISRQMFRALMRGDEVAVIKAVKEGSYHECPWKTPEQLWYDMQQIQKEDQAAEPGIMEP